MEKPKRKRKPPSIEIDLQEFRRGFDFGMGVFVPAASIGAAIAALVLLVEGLGIIKFALIAAGIVICWGCLWLIIKMVINIFRSAA